MTVLLFCVSLILVALVSCGIGGAVGFVVARRQYEALLEGSHNGPLTVESAQHIAANPAKEAAQPARVNLRAASPSSPVKQSSGKVAPATELRKLQADLSVAKKNYDEQSKQLKRHQRDARTDDLTLLLNRRALNEVLADLVKDGRNGQSAGTLMLVHVDHFQECNEKYGPATGDKVLQHASRIIRESLLGVSATAARYGGAEFAVVLNNETLESARKIIGEIQRGAEQTPFRDGALSIPVTLSGGLVKVQGNVTDTDLVSLASQALGAAKVAGNNRWYYFDGQQCVSFEHAASRQPGKAPEAQEPAASSKTQPGLVERKDRRAYRRQKCSGIYQVAPYEPGTPPAEEDFLNIRVADVSAGGCALLLTSAPSSKWFVVALKKPDEVVYVIAEVVHIKRARTDESAAPRFIVGCRFTGRISAPVARLKVQEV